jgi:hypothetical protein
VFGATGVDKRVKTPPNPSNNVPEPGSLLLVSLAGLALMRTRQRPPVRT